MSPEASLPGAKAMKPHAFRDGVLRLSAGIDAAVRWSCEAIVLLTIIVLLAVLGGNVAMRYAFAQGGIEWVSEVPAQLFPWMIAAGIVLAAQRGDHIAVDLAYKLLQERGAKLLAIFIHLLVIAAYVMLFDIAWDVAEIVSSEHSPLLGISGRWGYYALMLAAAGTAISSLTILVRVLVFGSSALPQANPEDSPT